MNNSFRVIFIKINIVNPKMPGGVQIDPLPTPTPHTLSRCGFSKNVFSEEMVKHWFFVIFNINLKNIFPENFIEFPLSFRRSEEILCHY